MKAIFVYLVPLVACLLLSIPVSQGQSDIQNVVDQYFDKRDQFESLVVEVDFRNKSFSRDDTLEMYALVETVCIPSDTLFEGHLFMLTEQKAFAYNGEKSYFGNLETSTLTISELKNHPGEHLIHDWSRNFIETSFLTKNQEGRAMLNDPDYKHTVFDTMIGQWPCKGLQFILPNMEEFTDLKVFVAFDTIDYMLRHRSISMWFQENEQYQSWTYHNPEYGHHTQLTLLNDEFLASFEHQELLEDVEPDFKDVSPEPIDYSSLVGHLMLSGDTFDIKDVSTEIIVLDFWYSACYPCIKSIPEVNKIYDHFNNERVAVYGVNIIDDEVKNKSRMEKYVRHNPMAYPTIMAENTTYNTWVPNGYPTLLILDANFTLIKSHTGLTENLADEIGEIIEKHLKD